MEEAQQWLLPPVMEHCGAHVLEIHVQLWASREVETNV